MEELTYKSIMTDSTAFDSWLQADDLKTLVRSVEKIDTAGAQVIIGLLEQQKIALTDLSDALQNELSFLGVSNG
jgi:DNA-binding MurR/RpiR family transcriptional regulator